MELTAHRSCLRASQQYSPIRVVQGPVAKLDDDEGVEDALGILLGALEPTLVANHNVADVQLAAVDRCGDEMVTPALVSVSCTSNHSLARRTSDTLHKGSHAMLNLTLITNPPIQTLNVSSNYIPTTP
jgi:hypothetical protein